MTEEQVIDELDRMYGDWRTDEERKAIEVAIQAIQKQIPQAVYLTGDGEWDGRIVYDTAECSCGKKFEDGDDDWESNYCPQCGQRLKWFEEVEENES